MTQTNKVANEVCITILKAILIGLNIIYMVSGVFLIGWSIYFIYLIFSFAREVAGVLMIIPLIMFAIGAIITSISCCGSCGAINQSPCLLKTYSSIVGGVAFIETALFIGSIVQWNSFEEKFLGQNDNKSINFTENAHFELKFDPMGPLRKSKEWFITFCVVSILSKVASSVIACVLLGLRPRKEDDEEETVGQSNSRGAKSNDDFRVTMMTQHMENMQKLHEMQISLQAKLIEKITLSPPPPTPTPHVYPDAPKLEEIAYPKLRDDNADFKKELEQALPKNLLD